MEFITAACSPINYKEDLKKYLVAVSHSVGKSAVKRRDSEMSCQKCCQMDGHCSKAPSHACSPLSFFFATSVPLPRHSPFSSLHAPASALLVPMRRTNGVCFKRAVFKPDATRAAALTSRFLRTRQPPFTRGNGSGASICFPSRPLSFGVNFGRHL